MQASSNQEAEPLSAPPLRRPEFKDVTQAASRLSGIAHHTPVLTSTFADNLCGAKLFFKCENFQRTGAFKFRGAYNAIASLSADQRVAGVVTYSSGNHAQALAHAGSLLSTKTTIIMPKDAPQLKVKATQGYGGDVLYYDRYTENREQIARKLAGEQGLTLIPPYDHPEVIAGQGTSAMELIESVGELDALYVPLGGGGLLAGSAIAARALLPNIRIIGVEPEAGNDGQQSMAAGKVVHIPVPRSIADGALVTHVGNHNFPILQDLVNEVVTVSDEQLILAMRFFAERMKIVVEPTGCLAAAAVMFSGKAFDRQRIGMILSGGNVDLNRFADYIKQS
jgi:threonine dehydratase